MGILTTKGAKGHEANDFAHLRLCVRLLLLAERSLRQAENEGDYAAALGQYEAALGMKKEKEEKANDTRCK